MSSNPMFKLERGEEQDFSCEAHGVYRGTPYRLLGISDPSWRPAECPKCRADAEERERIASLEDEARRKLERLERKQRLAGIPARFRGATLEGYSCELPAQQQVKTVFERYAENFAVARRVGRSVMLTGRPGTGKTHLMCALAQRLMFDWLVLYTDCYSMLSAVKGTFRRGAEETEDPAVGARSVDSDDVDAYDLILKDKERLLSFAEPTRFIFSHSALREGWDNPNVFVMCMLKHSDNTISRRQEVGRGLRLSVDQHGDRMDHPAVVHDINVLTVVASESYKDFVAGLQKEIAETLSSRPRQATEEYFSGKTITTEHGLVEVTAAMAKQIYRYLVKNDYTDDADQIADAYHEAKAAGKLADLPEDLRPHAEQVFQLIDSVFSDAQLPKIDDGRKPKTNPLNANFEKKEFQELWARINRKAVYRVEFDSAELIRKCVSALDSQLRVTPLQYTVQVGVQNDGLTDGQLRSGDGFTVTNTTTEHGDSIHSLVKYDLVGKVAENAQLTRDTAANILGQIAPAIFEQFTKNPEHFIAEASRIIAEQKAAMVIERLAYDEVDERYDVDIFTANQTSQDFSRATAKLKNHVYDYAITDSDVERDFVKELDTSSEVVVYAKLPRGFLIPTPVGDYNPDWAISFKTGSVRHIYFVAETKGTMSSMKLREIEKTKIECARKFFDEMSKRITADRVKYDVVTDYGKLIDLVGRAV